ncbi:hypothetical protein IIB97_00910 [Patescibacteria group bacterium]|nr:hypothetical protein [Patescibacteria group bacterium]
MKIQEFSIKQRKVILWVAVVALGIMLFFWWGKNVKETLENVSFPEVPKEFQESVEQAKEEFTFPAFEEIEIPEEVLKELQEYGQSQGQ